jgi:hypothetical protein
VGASTSHTPKGLHGLLQGQLYVLPMRARCLLLSRPPGFNHPELRCASVSILALLLTGNYRVVPVRQTSVLSTNSWKSVKIPSDPRKLCYYTRGHNGYTMRFVERPVFQNMFSTALSNDLILVRKCSAGISVFALLIHVCNDDRLSVLWKDGSCVNLSTQMHLSIFAEPHRLKGKAKQNVSYKEAAN